MEKNEFPDLRSWIVATWSMLGGMIIAWIDSQPNWDDTGITAGMLFIVAGIAGYFHPKRFWFWAVLCGIWIPLVAILRRGDVLMLLVLLIPMGGSFSGTLIRRIIKGE